MRELTLNNDEDDELAQMRQPPRKPIKLRTYNFKKPQFMKKLTDNYFKKSA